MNQTEHIAYLEKQNSQLKKDNEVLIDILAQMKVTLNRLINRYMTEDCDEETA